VLSPSAVTDVWSGPLHTTDVLLGLYLKDHGGWYDRAELVMRQLVDIQFAAAMGPPGGGALDKLQSQLRCPPSTC